METLHEIANDNLTIALATEALFNAHPKLRQAEDYRMTADGIEHFDVGAHEKDGITDLYFALLDKWTTIRYWLNSFCPDYHDWTKRFKNDPKVLQSAVSIWEKKTDYAWPDDLMEAVIETEKDQKACIDFVNMYVACARNAWASLESAKPHRVIATIQVEMGSEYDCDVFDGWCRIKAELESTRFFSTRISSVEVR
jgi:hypothetical protein